MATTRTTRAGSGATTASADAGAETTGGRAGSKARRIAFRTLAWLTSLEVVLLFSIALLEVGFMWLPDATAVSMFDDVGVADLVHRGHFNSIGIVAWALVPAILVQLRRPEQRVAAMLQAVGIVLAGTVLYALSGPLADWLLEEVTLLVPVLLLAVLHPRARELVRRPRLDRGMTVLVALAAVPWLAFAAAQAQLQWRDAAGDPHAAMEHWATSALMAVVIVLTGLIGATDHAGWRLPAWIAVLASIDYGLHSLAFPDIASNASTLLAVAAVVWGCAYAAAIVLRSRRQTARSSGLRTTDPHTAPMT
jgi:hypothetical protein